MSSQPVPRRRQKPRPDLSFILDRLAELEAMGLKLERGVEVNFSAEGGVTVVYTVSERRTAHDS